MQDPAATGVSWLTGLTEYGPVGIMLALSMLALGYAFKRLFDRALDEAKATGPKLDAIVKGLDQIREEMVSEMREIRHELSLTMAAVQRTNGERTPTPVMSLPTPRRKL